MLVARFKRQFTVRAQQRHRIVPKYINSVRGLGSSDYSVSCPSGTCLRKQSTVHVLSVAARYCMPVPVRLREGEGGLCGQPPKEPKTLVPVSLIRYQLGIATGIATFFS